MEEEQTVGESRADWLWRQQDDLVHRVSVSASYHGRRERFFNITERIFQAFTALTATVAWADIAGREGGTVRWFALAAAVASIIPLVFNLSGNAQRHGQLKTGFKTVLASLYAAGTELTEDQLVAFKAKVTELESGEPATLPAVVILCQNEIATRERKTVYPLTFWERCWMHVYPFDGSVIIDRAKRKADAA